MMRVFCGGGGVFFLVVAITHFRNYCSVNNEYCFLYVYYNQRFLFAVINVQHINESNNKETEYKSLRQSRQ